MNCLIFRREAGFLLENKRVIKTVFYTMTRRLQMLCFGYITKQGDGKNGFLLMKTGNRYFGNVRKHLPEQMYSINILNSNPLYR
jgi:hypothetical protein